MDHTVLLVDDPSSCADLEGGFRVERTPWYEAIGRAHEVAPSALVFVRPHRDAMLVASTLGWVHNVPVLLVDADEADLSAVPGARRVVSSRDRLSAIIRAALPA